MQNTSQNTTTMTFRSMILVKDSFSETARNYHHLYKSLSPVHLENSYHGNQIAIPEVMATIFRTLTLIH